METTRPSVPAHLGFLFCSRCLLLAVMFFWLSCRPFLPHLFLISQADEVRGHRALSYLLRLSLGLEIAVCGARSHCPRHASGQCGLPSPVLHVQPGPGNALLDGKHLTGGLGVHDGARRQGEHWSVTQGLPCPVSSINGQGRRAAHLLHISVPRRSCPSDS